MMITPKNLRASLLIGMSGLVFLTTFIALRWTANCVSTVSVEDVGSVSKRTEVSVCD
jgi:hypothetical protein